MSNSLWDAPLVHGPVTGVVRVPGSKSITNRALIIAALSSNPSEIRNALFARDTRLMVQNLQALGTAISGEELLVIGPTVRTESSPAAETTSTGPIQLDCGLAGTVMRFMPPLAAFASETVEFFGDERANERPMDVMINALRDLGVAIDDEDRGGLPFRITGTGRVKGGSITIDSSSSSQFISGLLLSGARFDEGLTLMHRGAPVPSLPHIDMTVDMLAAAGAQIESDTSDPANAWWSVAPGPLDLGELIIEPDLSNAAAFLAAAMVTGGSVTIPDWPANTTQAGDRIREIFAQMGGSWELTETGLTLTGPQQINGIHIDLGEVGELTPTIAAVAALATEPSHLYGIEHLRGHETDRLTALATELSKLGLTVTEEVDGLHIVPTPSPKAAIIETYHDHRMATFGAILGLRVEGIQVIDITTTGKTMPRFAQMWAQLIAGAQ